MGRLIDFDECEKQLTDFYESSLNDHDAMLFVEFMAQLENVPTAYDIEKVVEQIRENSFNSGHKAPITKIGTLNAIEIVRKGGGGVDGRVKEMSVLRWRSENSSRTN